MLEHLELPPKAASKAKTSDAAMSGISKSVTDGDGDGSGSSGGGEAGAATGASSGSGSSSGGGGDRSAGGAGPAEDSKSSAAKPGDKTKPVDLTSDSDSVYDTFDDVDIALNKSQVYSNVNELLDKFFEV